MVEPAPSEACSGSLVRISLRRPSCRWEARGSRKVRSLQSYYQQMLMLTMSEEETLAAASLQGALPLIPSEEIKLRILTWNIYYMRERREGWRNCVGSILQIPPCLIRIYRCQLKGSKNQNTQIVNGCLKIK